MTMERVDEKPPNITLHVRLDPTLVRQLEKETLTGGLERQAAQVLEVLGIPGTPVVDITSLEGTDLDAGRWLALSINERLCPFPAEWVLTAYEYSTGTSFPATPFREHTQSTLAELLPDQLVALICLVCGEIMSASPAALLGLDSAVVYREALARQTPETDLPEAQQLQLILCAVLGRRISIADQTTVGQVLAEGIDQGHAFAAIIEHLIAALRPKVIEVQLPQAYLEQITLQTSESERNSFSMMRDGLFYELGARYPSFQFAPVQDLKPYSVRLKINHLVTLPWRGLRAQEALVNDTPERLQLLRLQGRTAINPANGSACALIRAEDVELAKRAGLTTWSPMGHLVLAVSSQLRAHAHDFLDRDGVQSDLDRLDQPRLVEAVQARVPLEVLTQTLRQLIKEGVSLRNLPQILESVLEVHFKDVREDVYAPEQVVSDVQDGGWLHDSVNLASLVRTQIKRYLSHKYTQRENTLVVYLLDPALESLLAKPYRIATQTFLAQLAAQDRERVLAAVGAEVASLSVTAQPLVVLTTFGVRPVLQNLLAAEFPRVAVTCYQELAPSVNIQPVARIGSS